MNGQMGLQLGFGDNPSHLFGEVSMVLEKIACAVFDIAVVAKDIVVILADALGTGQSAERGASCSLLVCRA
jgi:hypothetical protein